MPFDILDYWKLYNRDSTSPDSYIEMALYFMISSALQRKVWLQSSEHAIFPNQYIVLCGPPGVGKGLVIRPAAEILRYHKINPIKNLEANAAKSNLPKEELDAIIAAAKELKLKQMEKKGDEWEEPLLIPIAAQASTFESLVNVHAKSVSRINPSNPDDKFCVNGIYSHSSLSIVLSEMSSLFRKKSEDLVQYLIAGYDCEEEYKYETKHQGRDRVRKGCLNLLAGTTPEFLQNSSSEKLLGDGFFSRIMIVFEEKSKCERLEFSEFTPEQSLAKQRVIDHIARLAGLFGQLRYTPAAYDFLKHYVEQIMPDKPTNPDPKLEYYYSRKKLHLQKLAVAVHFSRSIEMYVELEEVQYALELMNTIELKMHLGLGRVGKNPLSDVAKKIVKFISKAGPQSYIDLWTRFEMDVREAELIEVLKGLGEREVLKLKPHGKSYLYTVNNEPRPDK